MNTEFNKNLVREYVAAFNTGDLAKLISLFSPDAQIQGVLAEGSLEKVASIWQQLMNGLKINLTIEEMIAEADTVAVRYTERGVFQGEFLGHTPTGNSYQLVAMEWFTIKNGKIIRRWGARDGASQARQLGIPSL